MLTHYIRDECFVTLESLTQALVCGSMPRWRGDLLLIFHVAGVQWESETSISNKLGIDVTFSR